jgi:hypothetical protein
VQKAGRETTVQLLYVKLHVSMMEIALYPMSVLAKRVGKAHIVKPPFALKNVIMEGSVWLQINANVYNGKVNGAMEGVEEEFQYFRLMKLPLS